MNRLAQNPGTLGHVRERLRAAHQGLRNRFSQTLGLHQGVAGRLHLLRHPVAMTQRKQGHDHEQQQRQTEHDRQQPLMLKHRSLAQDGQGNQVGRLLR